MGSLSSFSALFIEGTTTHVRSGAKFAYLALFFLIVSIIGQVVTGIVEYNESGCNDNQMKTWDASCFSKYMTTIKRFTPFRILFQLIDASSAICLLVVGNALENVFRNTLMARVMGACVRLSMMMVVFEVCYIASLQLQMHDFVTIWTFQAKHRYVAVPLYEMMDHSSDMIWTLDNLLNAYFLLILGFLASDTQKFPRRFHNYAFIGGVCGIFYLICNLMRFDSMRIMVIPEIFSLMVMELCFMGVVLMTGRALSQMEGDLVGRKKKKGKKGKKGKKDKKDKNRV